MFCLFFSDNSAMTGSGKTAAFLLPVMERILQRGGLSSKKWSTKGSTTTRGLVLTPTREVGIQFVSVVFRYQWY